MVRRIPKRPIERDILSWNKEQKYCLDTPERALNYCQKLSGNSENRYCSVEELISDNEELELVLRPMANCDGALEKLDENRFRILVNSNNPETRRRFTMAHEFAHYQLHRNEIDNLPIDEKILFRDDNRDSREYAANEYAASILMPESEFLSMLDEELNGTFDSSKLAERFHVSKAAVEFRARNLGLNT